MNDHQQITAERGRRAEDLRAAAVAMLEQQTIAAGVMLDLDSDQVVAAGPKSAILYLLSNGAPAATSGDAPDLQQLKALALAWTSVYDSWLSEGQIADGITDKDAVDFIRAVSPTAFFDLVTRIERSDSVLADMEARKDAAYYERNQVVAALAKCFPSGVARTAIEGWSEDWHGCVYIDLPTGQASWHFHDSQAHLFAGLPPYQGKWDGHTTEEKYERLARIESAAAPAPTGGLFTVEQVQAMIAADRAQIAATKPAAAPVVPQGVAGLLLKLRDEGVLSEGQITQALGVDRLTCREILDGVHVVAAPAVPEGWKLALHAAVCAIYLDDSSDFRSSLVAVVRHLDAELAGELLGNPKAAYDKSCAMLEATPAASTPAAPANQTLIGKLLDDFSNIDHLWGLNEPGALVRHWDVFNLIVAAGKAFGAATPAASTTGAAQTAEQVRDQALEDAAKACEAWGDEKVAKWTEIAGSDENARSIVDDAKARAWDALQCATAIRALKRPTPTHSSEAGDD